MNSIEFTGISGAGKTIIADKLAQVFINNNFKVVRSIDAGYIRPFFYLLMHPSKIVLSLSFFIKYVRKINKESTHFLKRWLMVQARMELLKRIDNKNIIIYDEGLIHVFRSFRRLTDNKFSIKYFWEHQTYNKLFRTLPDVIIYVTCNTEIVLERLSMRDGIISQDKIGQILKQISNEQKTINDCNFYQSVSYKKFFKIDNSQELTEKIIYDLYINILST